MVHSSTQRYTAAHGGCFLLLNKYHPLMSSVYKIVGNYNNN